MFPVDGNVNIKEEEWLDWKKCKAALKSGTERSPAKYAELGNLYYSRANLFAGIIRDTYLGKAIKKFKKSLDYSPNTCYSYKNLGNVYVDKNEPLEALKYLENSLCRKEEVFGESTAVVWAKAYLKTGRIPEAIEETTRILRIDETKHEAYRLRAEAYEKQRELIKASVDRVTLLMQDGINRLSGIFSQSEAPILSFEVNSTDTSPRVLELPDLDKEQSDFHRHVYEGKQTYCLARIGEGMEPIQKLTEAENCFLKAEAMRDPTTQADLKDALYWLGLIDWRLGKRKSAQAYFKKALSLNQDDSKTKDLLEMSSHLNRAHYFYSGQFAVEMGEKEDAYLNFKHFLEISSDRIGAYEAVAAISCAEFCLAEKNYPEFRIYLSHLSRCSSASLDVLLRTIGLLQEFRQHLQNYMELVPSSDTVEKLQSLKNNLGNFLSRLFQRARKIALAPLDQLKIVQLYFAESHIEVDNFLNALEGKTGLILCSLLRAKYYLLFSEEKCLNFAKSILAPLEDEIHDIGPFSEEKVYLLLKLKIEIFRREKNWEGLTTLSAHIKGKKDGELHFDYALAIKEFDIQSAIAHLEDAKKIKPCFKVFKELVEALLENQENVEALSYMEAFLHYPPQDRTSLQDFAVILVKLGLIQDFFQVQSILEQLGVSIPEELQAEFQKKKSAIQLTNIAKGVLNLKQTIEYAKKATEAYPHIPAYLLLAESYEKKLRFDGSSLEDLVPIWASYYKTTFLPGEDLQKEMGKTHAAVKYDRCARLLMETISRSSNANRKELFRFYGRYLPSEMQEVMEKMGIHKGFPKNLAQEYCLIGACFAKKGRWKLASESYRLAQAYSPHKDFCNFLIEEAREKHKILEDTLESYQKAIDLGETSAVHKQAVLLMKVGRLDEARAVVEKIPEGAECFPEIGRAKSLALEEREYLLRKMESVLQRPIRVLVDYAQECLDALGYIDLAQEMPNMELFHLVWNNGIERISSIQTDWMGILASQANDLEDFTYAHFPEEKDLSGVFDLIHAKLEKSQDEKEEMLEWEKPIEDIESGIDDLEHLLDRWQKRFKENDTHQITRFNKTLAFFHCGINIVKDRFRNETRPDVERLLDITDPARLSNRLRETELHSDDFPLILELAYACERAERGKEAIFWYELALCLIPTDRHAIFRLVYLIQELQLAEDKMQHYSHLISQNPTLYRCLYPILGELYSSQNHPEARDFFVRALNSFPHELWLYERLTALFQRENTPEEEILDLFRNLEVKEVFLKCYFLLLGNHERAQNYALENNGSSSLSLRLDVTGLEEFIRQQGSREDPSLIGSDFIRNCFYEMEKIGSPTHS